MHGATEYSCSRDQLTRWGFVEEEIADLCQPRLTWKTYYDTKKREQCALYDKVLGQSNMIPASMSGS